MSTWDVTNPEIEKFIEDGNTTLTNIDSDFATTDGRHGRLMFLELKRLLNESNMNPYQELKAWRKLGKQMIGYMKTVSAGFNACARERKRYTNYENDRQGKRWTDAEDEMLIELLCDDKEDLLSVSRTLGRSVSAISARCSYLVGVKRKEQSIMGLFQGKLNGLVVNGTIDGILLKNDE